MISFHKNYAFKYMPPQTSRKVYIISRTGSSLPITHTQMYVAPFTPYDVATTTSHESVIVAFVDKRMGKAYVPINPDVSSLASIDMDDLQFVGSLMNMPVVIILSEYCEMDTQRHVYDIFYTHKTAVQNTFPMMWK